MDACSGEAVHLPIEPLVGLMRHPVGNQYCVAPDGSLNWTLDPAHQPRGQPVENKAYMVVSPLLRAQLRSQYPGRKYLFDLGDSLLCSRCVCLVNTF